MEVKRKRLDVLRRSHQAVSFVSFPVKAPPGEGRGTLSLDVVSDTLKTPSLSTLLSLVSLREPRWGILRLCTAGV